MPTLPVPASLPGWPDGAVLPRDGDWTTGDHVAVVRFTRWISQVRATMKWHEIPAEQVASAVGVSSTALSNVLRGTSWPKADLVLRLTAFLEIDHDGHPKDANTDEWRARKGQEVWGTWRHRQRDRMFMSSSGKRQQQRASPPPRSRTRSFWDDEHQGIVDDTRADVLEGVAAVLGPWLAEHVPPDAWPDEIQELTMNWESYR